MEGYPDTNLDQPLSEENHTPTFEPDRQYESGINSILADNQQVRKPERQYLQESQRTPQSQTDEHLQRENKAFDELLEAVKFAPEAKQEVLATHLEQLRMIGQHLKEVRGIEQSKELKLKMLAHWEAIREATNGNTMLETALYNWLDAFAEEDVRFHEAIEDLRIAMDDPLLNAKLENIRITTTIAEILSMLNNPELTKAEIDKILQPRVRGNLYKFEETGDINDIVSHKGSSPFDDLISTLESPNAMHEFDFQREQLAKALSSFTNIQTILGSAIASIHDPTKKAAAIKLLKDLEQQTMVLYRNLSKAVNTYRKVVPERYRHKHFGSQRNARPPWLDNTSITNYKKREHIM